MKCITLHADAGRHPIGGVSLELQSLSAAESAGEEEIVRAVIPAPGDDGRLATRDGTEIRVSDPAALAEALNAQGVDVRIDFDHQSEPSSPTFRDSTAAEGWLSQFRAAADGAIEAVLELSNWARHRIINREYRYLSPALMADGQTREVVSMSSLALVNNPNLALSLNNTGGSPADDGERERKLAAREETATRLMMSAAERSVDSAIEGKRLAPAQKDFVLNSIRSHPDGIERGIEAFEAAFLAGASAPALHNLDRRVGPTGAPAAGAAPAAKFRGPLGVDVNEEGLTVDCVVSAHARERGISYRQSVLELGALQQ